MNPFRPTACRGKPKVRRGGLDWTCGTRIATLRFAAAQPVHCRLPDDRLRARQKTIHCDIKPENVRLGKYGETIVLDWGLAISVEQRKRMGWGTRWYMSPEQAGIRSDPIGAASDFFSLGATLFTILNGRPPFDGEQWAEWQRRSRRRFPETQNTAAGRAKGPGGDCTKGDGL